jgi:hypothetical protein
MTCETTNIPAPKPPNMMSDYFSLVTDRRIILRGIVGEQSESDGGQPRGKKRRCKRKRARVDQSLMGGNMVNR